MNGGAGLRPGLASGRIPAAKPQVPIHGGASYMTRNSREMTSHSGDAIRMRPNGRPSDFHDARRNMDIHHGLNGGSRVFVEHSDHSRVVYERGRPGFVQRPYNFRGHDFARQTYYYQGRSYSHFYHGYAYHGVFINVYAPSVFYHPAYYGWAYNPWAVPVHYGWGWYGSPWYRHYGYYFAPYSVYPSAAFWLTDFMLAAALQQSYDAQMAAGEAYGPPPDSGGAPELTPEVKQQIADEVRNQLALENQEAQQNAQQQDINPGSSGIDRMLNDGETHVFVVGATLDVVDADQSECSLSEGDVLGLQSPPIGDARAVDLLVLASKGGQECPRQDIVSVSLDDLQEMQNHMRETIDQGLQELQAKQGQGGIPQAPPAAAQQTTAVYAPIAPPPDPNVSAELQQQASQAGLAEAEVTASVPQ